MEIERRMAEVEQRLDELEEWRLRVLTVFRTVGVAMDVVTGDARRRSDTAG